jgi:predicted glycosyltransferase
MKSRGHSFLITARDKDVTHELMKAYDIPFVSRGKGSHTRIGRFINSIGFFFKYFIPIAKFNPDICVGIGSPYLTLFARALRKPGIVFEDTESAKMILLVYKIFADVILTPGCFRSNLGHKQIRLNCYKETSSLHKSYFSPDINIYKLLQLPADQRYVLCRFVSHRVNHDNPDDGLTLEMKKTLIERLSAQVKVFTSTEKGLKPDFPENEIHVPPEKMHDVIAYSSLVIGESATMAAEAAVLGVPAIFFDNHGRGYTDELEHTYQMVCNYNVSATSVEKALKKASEILSTPDYVSTRTSFRHISQEHIDLTAFLVWFTENYPEGFRIMKEDPDYQYRFR